MIPKGSKWFVQLGGNGIQVTKASTHGYIRFAAIKRHSDIEHDQTIRNVTCTPIKSVLIGQKTSLNIILPVLPNDRMIQHIMRKNPDQNQFPSELYQPSLWGNACGILWRQVLYKSHFDHRLDLKLRFNDAQILS